MLDTGTTVLRAEDRKQLLHEGAGTHVLSAFAEITLDNSERRIPIDKDEVVIRRAIGLKKDEYFIDRKHASKTEVADLLESAGLSRSNPMHIVPQGRVMALTTMKDGARLEMTRVLSRHPTRDGLSVRRSSRDVAWSRRAKRGTIRPVCV